MKKLLKKIFGGWIKEPSKISKLKDCLIKITENDKSIMFISAAANIKSGETSMGIVGSPSDLVQMVVALMREDDIARGVITRAVLNFHVEDIIVDQKVDDLFNELGIDVEDDK